MWTGESKGSTMKRETRNRARFKERFTQPCVISFDPSHLWSAVAAAAPLERGYGRVYVLRAVGLPHPVGVVGVQAGGGGGHRNAAGVWARGQLGERRELRENMFLYYFTYSYS